MNADTLITCGVVLLTVATIASGGGFLMAILGGKQAANDLQKAFFRAGHAHAGVLVILGLVVQLLTSQPGVPQWASSLGYGVLFAAILMPLGFFLSVIGRDPQRPNGWRISIWLGAAALVIGVIGSGIGLIVGGAAIA